MYVLDSFAFKKNNILIHNMQRRKIFPFFHDLHILRNKNHNISQWDVFEIGHTIIFLIVRIKATLFFKKVSFSQNCRHSRIKLKLYFF